MGLFASWLSRRSRSSPLEVCRKLLAQRRDLEAREILEAWIPRAPEGDLPAANALLARACLALNLEEQAAAAAAQGLVLDDTLAELHLCLGMCARREGALARAERCFRLCLTLDPGNVESALELCQVLCASGRAAEALEWIREGRIEVDPDLRVLFARANVYAELHRLDEARACLAKFLETLPDHPEALMNLGVIESRRGEDTLAVGHFRRALRMNPEDAETSLNLAMSLRRLGRFNEGIELLQSLEADSASAPRVFSLLADLYAEAGEFDKAKICHAQAANIDLGDPTHHCRLGTLLLETGQFSDAIDALAKSLAIRETAEANRTMGLALLRSFRPHEALGHLEAASRLAPNDAETGALMIAARGSLSRNPREQLDECRRAVAENPTQAFAYSNLLFHLSFDQQTSPEDYLKEALKFGARFGAGPVKNSVASVELKRNAASRPLRLGFVSGDLHSHPVGLFFEALISEINTERFQLFGYPNTPKTDALTRRIQSRFTSWELIRFLDDQNAADLIRSQGVDILFDLSGHTGMNRLPMFALRPAPIQVTWLGYWASTGLPEIDYLVADPLSVPDEHEHHFSERVIRMPVTRLCYGDSLPQRPEPAQAPFSQNGYVTFGCFQSLHKITDTVLMSWRRIMEADLECRLRVRCVQFAEQAVIELAAARFIELGLPEDRIELLAPLTRSAYLQAYSEVDVALDTFPYPGGTTTTEALWMGVPTITMSGTSMLARQGLALMSAAGMQEWVAHSIDEYVEMALQVCSSPQGVAAMRQQLRHRVKGSPLFDTRRFARDFEALVEEIAGTQQAPRKTGT